MKGRVIAALMRLRANRVSYKKRLMDMGSMGPDDVFTAGEICGVDKAIEAVKRILPSRRPRKVRS